MTNKEKNYVVWKPYPKYPFIEANQFGDIRTIDRTVVGKDGKKYHIKGRVLKQQLNKNGYMYVGVKISGKRIILSVHRIVATCFLPNPKHLEQVNHKDCNRLNNNVSNLEWCSASYNNQYREKYSEAKGHSVFAVNLETLEVLHFPSQSEASRQLGVSVQSINDVIKGRCNTAKGYLFTEDESEITKEKIQEIKAKMRFLGGVIAVNLKSLEVLRFESQHEAARQLGVNQSDITMVTKEKLNKVGRYWFCNADKNAMEKVKTKFGDEIANRVRKLMSEI